MIETKPAEVEPDVDSVRVVADVHRADVLDEDGDVTSEIYGTIWGQDRTQSEITFSFPKALRRYPELTFPELHIFRVILVSFSRILHFPKHKNDFGR